MSTIQLNNFSLEEMSEVIERVVRRVLFENDQNKSFLPNQTEELLSRKDVARILKVHITTVHNWTKSGTLKAHKVEGQVRYLRSELNQCLTPVRPQQS